MLSSMSGVDTSFRRQLTNSNPMLGGNSYISSLSLHGDLLQMSCSGETCDGAEDEVGADGDGGGSVADTECGSPLSIESLGSLHSSRSHDGVFLRPGAAVSRCNLF